MTTWGSIGDFGRWGGWWWRMQRRTRAWAAEYRAYLDQGAQHPPYPVVLQVTPTEACNLHCPYCNQWGEHGYHKAAGAPRAQQMDVDALIDLLERFRRLRADFMFNLHGGEPFLHPQMGRLLDHLHETDQETYVSTNATRLEPHVERLARINRRTTYQVSLDGGEEKNDAIRGKGVSERAIRNLDALAEACRKQGTGRPKININFLLHGGNDADDVRGVLQMAKRVGAFIVSVSLQQEVRQEAGEAFEQEFSKRFGVAPSQRWRGSLTDDDFATTGDAVDFAFRYMRRRWFYPVPPFVGIYPSGLTREQTRRFHSTHEGTFGVQCCMMPAYWCRVAADGTVHHCSGFMDVDVGNVLRGDFADVWRGELSLKVQRMAQQELWPICSRCCGLYLATALVRGLPREFYVPPNW